MQHGLFAVEQVVIGLDLKFVVVIPVVAPATQHVERQKIGVEILGASHCRGGLHHEGDALPYTATAHIAQKGQMVRWAAFDICAEADAPHVPVIPHGLVACSGGATPIHSLRIEAKSAPRELDDRDEGPAGDVHFLHPGARRFRASWRPVGSRR